MTAVAAPRVGGARSRTAHLLASPWAALAILVALGVAGAFQHELWTPDEPREAEVAREMLLSNWSAAPTLGGEPFLEKPPLFPWVAAASYALFGVSAAAARIPSVLAGIAAGMVAWAMGRRAGGPLAGFLAAVVLVTTSGFADLSHSAINDSLLMAFVAGGHLAFLAARDAHRAGRASWALAAAGACAGLAFLTKGPIGPILLAGPPIVAAAFLREWGFLRHALPRAALWCGVGVLVVGGPWALALARERGWDAVDTVLVKNTIGRSLGSDPEKYGFSGKSAPPWYYLTGFPVEALPWFCAAPAFLLAPVLSKSWRSGRTRFLAALVVSGLLLLSIPSGKRGLYAVPLLPAWSVVIGVWLSRVGSTRGGRFDRPWVAVLCGVFALLGLVLVAGPVLVAARVEDFPLDPPRALAGLALIAAGGLTAYAAARHWAHGISSGVKHAVAAALVLVFAWHAAGRPFADPVKSMRDGALRVAAAVPAGEELLGLSLDETTIAVVPFYSGRTIRNVETWKAAREQFDAGRTRHLVVMDKHVERKLGERARTELDPVARLRFAETRELWVFRRRERPPR